MTVDRVAFGSACVVALAVALVFWTTYPLNVGAYDYPNYLRMIADGSSNLIHASGYPAVLHALLSLLNIQGVDPILHNTAWQVSVQRMQNVLHFGLFAMVLWLCAVQFGVRAASLVALGWGTNILFLSNVNAAAPEWLQGHFMVIALLLAARARTLPRPWQTAVLACAAIVMALAYLVKYNSLLVAPGVVAFAFMASTSWRRRFLHLGVMLAAAVVVVSIYAHAFHARTTGTTKLSYDHTWVLTTALPPDYFRRDPESLGLWSLRFAALCALTPPKYDVAAAWPHIDWGAPADERANFSATYERVMRLSREDLIALLRNNPLPPTITNFTSSVPLYYYYGLKRADQFGARIFLEAVLREPAWMAARVFGGLWQAMSTVFSARMVPTPQQPLGHRFGQTDRLGFAPLAPPADPPNPFFTWYYSPMERVWLPGTRVVDFVFEARSSRAVFIFLNLAALLGLLAMHRGRGKAEAAILAVSMSLFVAGAVALLGLRLKEAVAVAPTFFVVWGAGLAGVIDYTFRRLRIGVADSGRALRVLQ
jgi:hypothetical protein